SMGPHVRREIDEYSVERSGWTLRYTLSSEPASGEDGQREERSLRVADVAYGRTNHYTVAVPCSSYIFSSQPSGGQRFIAQFAAPAATDGERTRLFWATGVDRETRELHGVGIRDAYDFDHQVFQEDVAIVENCWPR